MLAYNILRWIGRYGLLGADAPPRHRAKRRRIRTLMQELMYLTARLSSHQSADQARLGLQPTGRTHLSMPVRSIGMHLSVSVAAFSLPAPACGAILLHPDPLSCMFSLQLPLTARGGFDRNPRIFDYLDRNIIVHRIAHLCGPPIDLTSVIV
jgi:hypothetical protein